MMGKFVFWLTMLALVVGVVLLDPYVDFRGRADSFLSYLNGGFDEPATSEAPASHFANQRSATPVATATRVRARATPTALPNDSGDISFVYRSQYPAGVDERALKLMREDMLDMINDKRARAGAGSVTLGHNRSPQAHAEYMRDRCIVSHTGAGGSGKRDRWIGAGGSSAVNLAENVNGYRTCTFTVPSSRTLRYYVQKMMDTLMASTGHRAIIENDRYDEVHLGLAISRNGMWVTQVFVGR